MLRIFYIYKKKPRVKQCIGETCNIVLLSNYWQLSSIRTMRLVVIYKITTIYSARILPTEKYMQNNMRGLSTLAYTSYASLTSAIHETKITGNHRNNFNCN